MDDDRFYVKTLTLENFRCFERLELRDLDPHFNLLVGENGTGKSSVLVALASLLREIATVPAAIAMGALVDEADVRTFSDKRRSPFPEPRSVDFSASFEWFGEDLQHRETLTFPRLPGSASTSRAAISLSARADKTYPVLARFSTIRQFHRVSGLREFNDTSFAPRRWDAFHDWSNAGASADELRLWLKNETLIAFQQAQTVDGEPAANPPPATALTLVQGACAAVVEGAVDIAFIQARNDIVVTFADGRRLAFTTMSDGQRALVGLVAEIARRACILNWEVLGEKCLTETPGLVLIDEIDLHLHPKWQRQIIKALKDIFPKNQFFATTHSPQVIGEAQPHEIVLLTKDGKQKRPMGSFGMDSNWILECVMEAQGRNPEVAKRVSALFDLIDEGRFEEARAEIDSLRREIGPLAPDIAGAESYMWRIEHEADEAAE